MGHISKNMASKPYPAVGMPARAYYARERPLNLVASALYATCMTDRHREAPPEAVEPTSGETISTREAALRLGITPRAVRRAAQSGELPAIRVNRRWRLLREPFDRLLSDGLGGQSNRGGRPKARP